MRHHRRALDRRLAIALAVLGVVWLAPTGDASADVGDPCVREKSPGDTFKVCFDPGNRLYVSASAKGIGAGLLLRHRMLFDDEPDLTWKLEHEVIVAELGYDERGVVTAYRGRYLRHARDGHIVLPFGLPRKLFVPFDVGAETEVGIFRGPIREDEPFTVGVIRAAALIDAYRGNDFRHRVAFGVGSRWDLMVDRDPLSVAEQFVAPLTIGVLDVHFESKNGLTQFTMRGEAGGEWSSSNGWRRVTRAETSLERVAVAINDRALSFYGRVKFDDDTLSADVGLRLAAF